MRKTVILVLIMLLTLSLAACSGNGGNTKKSNGTLNGTTADNNKPVKLVMWNTAYPTIDDNDKSKKKEDFYLYQAIQRYKEKKPNVTITVQDIPGGPESFTKYKTASIAKNGPDIMTLWSGSYTMGLKQFLEPLDDYGIDEERNNLIGWNTVTDGLIEGKGKIYGFPLANDGIITLYYNKKMIKDAGLDFENSPPASVDEWILALEKLKAIGIEKPVAWDDYGFWFIPAYWIGQLIGQEGLVGLSNGTQKFDDPQIAEVVAKWSEIYKKGLVATDQPGQLFQQKKTAMVPGGGWVIVDARKALGDDLGMIKIPNFKEGVKVPDSGIGGVGTSIVVSNYSKNKEEAVAFLKFLASKEETEERLKLKEGNMLVVNKQVDISKYDVDPLLVTMQQWAQEPSVLFYLDNTLPAEVANEITSQSVSALKGQLSAEAFLKKVDQKVAETLGK
ncbi:extracellular solute-binding protein (plasmid) [Paenibacillus rhizovicinus]|uniref:Extracellular solute-binding protein n=1 Tax=Paenibacillus rhizovicinus TaxID=2704463 RepID=A0A6C0PAR6_9BACL|nr:extracellular solute-binding protein [Paenibacillus rhizovicinus]QHW35526.1 extracellular solute-binding protein [Paenibacillus rhizovicinus]